MKPQIKDPRDQWYVSCGIWPDCPECQGLLSPKFEHIPPAEGDFMSFNKVVVPCPECLAQTSQIEGAYLPWHTLSRVSVPYGTWPDCSECHGWGGHSYESSWDGCRSERGFAPCQTCKKRTAKYHRSHPTDLDQLLDNQLSELKPLIDKRKAIEDEVRQIEGKIRVMAEAHKLALEPYLEQIRQARQLVTS